jgi:hypothetical protein
MTVADLIHLLATQDPAALVVLYDRQEPAAIRELQTYEIKSVAVYRTHPDRAPRLDNSPEPRGEKLQAIILGWK